MSSAFRLDKYLARIGFNGPIGPDLATLSTIHAAHVDAIPFEGFDPLLRRPVNLDIGSIQEKLVDSRRGGYCFEQNLLFKSALDAIGFRVTGLAARVRWTSPPDSPLGPRTHMLLKVDLPVWRCDACSAEVYSYHSCKNRNCPKCHTDQTKRWFEARKIEMLPCRYFHVTITVPEELRDVLRANQRDGYALLMKAAAESIIEIARDSRYVGATVGVLAVLHTWTQQPIVW